MSRAVNTTSATDPMPEPRHGLAVWGVVAGLALWAVSLVAQRVAGIGEAVAAVHRGWSEPVGERIQRASGLSPAMLTAIRDAVDPDGRLVLYSPYGGAEFELDAADPRGEPARQVRTLFERAKNLLYPRPRDVHFARSPDELQQKLRADLVGRLLVVDGTQAPDALTVGGRWQLLHEDRLGSARLRLWRFVEVR